MARQSWPEPPQSLAGFNGFDEKMVPLCGAWRQIGKVTSDD